MCRGVHFSLVLFVSRLVFFSLALPLSLTLSLSLNAVRTSLVAARLAQNTRLARHAGHLVPQRARDSHPRANPKPQTLNPKP